MDQYLAISLLIIANQLVATPSRRQLSPACTKIKVVYQYKRYAYDLK